MVLPRCAIAGVAGVALLIAWLNGTRPFSLLFDRFFTWRVASLAVRPITVDKFGGMQIGEWWLTIPVEELRIRDFFAEGNELSLTKERSYLAWPNPFETNFMTGNSPKWKRFTYYRLVAKKPSGARLEMDWRFVEYFYKFDGWVGADMTDGDHTGLIRIVQR
jgi:hypothetical protein